MLERVGSHFIHPDRDLHERPSLSVELVYLHPSPGFSIEDARNRVLMARSKGDVDVYLRVDYQPGQTLPPTDNTEALDEYLNFARLVAGDNILARSRGLIFGNETNLSGEWAVSGIQLSIDWIAQILYGTDTPSTNRNNVYNAVRDVNPNVLIFVPAVAPFSPESTGIWDYTPPDGRLDLSPWERYQYELAYKCFNNDNHAPAADIYFAMHTYSRVGIDGTANGGAEEPTRDIQDNPFGAQWGTRVLGDMIYAIQQAAEGVPIPGFLVSEWNSLTDGKPKYNYPRGLEQNVVAYLHSLDVRILGLACFVDQNLGGGWGETAMTAYESEGDPLFLWNQDHNDLLLNGWGNS